MKELDAFFQRLDNPKMSFSVIQVYFDRFNADLNHPDLTFSDVAKQLFTSVWVDFSFQSGLHFER
jgi:hypothetical protein